MKKITQEEFVKLINRSDPSLTLLWERIEEIQSHLESNLSTDRSEPMSIRDIILHMRARGWSDVSELMLFALAGDVQPLTVKQGFVPDWEKAPHPLAVVEIFWSWYADKMHHQNCIAVIPLPSPPKVKRMRTREEKIEALDDLPFLGIYPKQGGLTDEILDNLCRAANISLEVEE